MTCTTGDWGDDFYNNRYRLNSFSLPVILSIEGLSTIELQIGEASYFFNLLHWPPKSSVLTTLNTSWVSMLRYAQQHEYYQNKKLFPIFAWWNCFFFLSFSYEKRTKHDDNPAKEDFLMSTVCFQITTNDSAKENITFSHIHRKEKISFDVSCAVVFLWKANKATFVSVTVRQINRQTDIHFETRYIWVSIMYETWRALHDSKQCSYKHLALFV